MIARLIVGRFLSSAMSDTSAKIAFRFARGDRSPAKREMAHVESCALRIYRHVSDRLDRREKLARRQRLFEQSQNIEALCFLTDAGIRPTGDDERRRCDCLRAQPRENLQAI